MAWAPAAESTGAAAPGAMFAVAMQAPDISAASAEAIARGMHATFAVAALLVVLALVVVVASRMIAAERNPEAPLPSRLG